MDENKKIVMGVAPTNWDLRPLSLAHEIATFLESVKDEGSHIDSGSMDGVADLWVTVDGVQYWISITNK